MEKLNVRETEDGVVFAVHVLPRSKKDGVAGFHGDAMKVKLSAPPVEGAANKALLKLFSRLLHVPKGDVEILRGETGRDKLVLVRGVGSREILRLLEGGKQ